MPARKAPGVGGGGARREDPDVAPAAGHGGRCSPCLYSPWPALMKALFINRNEQRGENNGQEKAIPTLHVLPSPEPGARF